jgi:predicted nucleotidyltransferase
VVDPEIKNIILRFVKAIKVTGIRIERVVLYGSYASGRAHSESDLDIAVVSPDFGKDRFEEGVKLNRIAWRIDPKIEAIPVSSRSYENDTWLPMIDEIKSKGIEIETT